MRFLRYRAGRRHRRSLHRRRHGGLEPHGRPLPVRHVDRARRHARCRDHRHQLRGDHEHPEDVHKGVQPAAQGLNAKVAELVGYAEAARRDGLLALDEVTSTIEDPFTKNGLELVVDGTDPDLVADILESENDAMRTRHAAGVQPFDKAGGYAPTMGIIGTVFGLIHVLSNLDKPATLGPSISAAFVSTLLGVASANVIYLPISARLKQLPRMSSTPAR